ITKRTFSRSASDCVTRQIPKFPLIPISHIKIEFLNKRHSQEMSATMPIRHLWMGEYRLMQTQC
ncbi:hypothetical protein ACNRDB_15765, partial [Ralstonia pseudosolanacearum]